MSICGDGAEAAGPPPLRMRRRLAPTIPEKPILPGGTKESAGAMVVGGGTSRVSVRIGLFAYAFYFRK